MAETVKPAETYDDRPIHAETPLPPEVQAPLAEYRGELPPSPQWFKAAIAREPERVFVESLGSKLEVLTWGGLVRGAARALAQQVTNAHILSAAEVTQVWSQGRADGRREGACRADSESSGEILLRQFETPLIPPPAAEATPRNWPGRVG